MEPPPPDFATDLLNRHGFAEDLERFILTEHHFVDGGLVISLNAPFGSGKTTFLNMWAADLRARRVTSPTLPRPVVINAWESDYCGDPLISIVSALTQALQDPASTNPEPANATELREAIKDISWFFLGVANSFIMEAVQVDILEGSKLAEEKKHARKKPPGPRPSIVEAYEHRSTALAKLKSLLSATFGAESPRVIIFIDELDRCRPDFAISYLETIKHIFDVHGIVFVLAVDERQLQSVAAVLFGPHLSFPEYYRKFVQRTIYLPEPDKQGYSQLAQAYTERYLVPHGKRWCIYKLGTEEVESLTQLLGAFQLTPRQFQEVFRTLGHAFAKDSHNHNMVRWAYGGALIFMGALRIYSHDIYRRLGTDRAAVKEIGTLLSALISNDHHRRWLFNVIVTGFKRDLKWQNDVLEAAVRLEYIAAHSNVATQGNMPTFFREVIEAWGGDDSSKSGLSDVFNRIEKVASFESPHRK